MVGQKSLFGVKWEGVKTFFCEDVCKLGLNLKLLRTFEEKVGIGIAFSRWFFGFYIPTAVKKKLPFSPMFADSESSISRKILCFAFSQPLLTT